MYKSEPWPAVLLVLACIAASACTLHPLGPVSDLDLHGFAGAGSLRESMESMATDCVARINEAAASYNQSERNTQRWSIVLALSAGAGSAVGIESAARGSTDRPDQNVAYAAAAVVAISSILAPFVVTKDRTIQASNEHALLLSDLKKAASSEIPRDKWTLYYECAYGYPEFITPPRPIPAALPPIPRK